MRRGKEKLFNFFTKFFETLFQKPRFKKYAGCYISLYHDDIRVSVLANTNYGSLNGYKVYFLSEDASNREVGEKIIRALEEYVKDFKYPKNQNEQKKIDDQIKKNMKITSWRKFSKEAKVVSCNWDGKQLEMYPIIRYRGFYAGGNKHVCIVNVDDLEAIGRTARELFPLSK